MNPEQIKIMIAEVLQHGISPRAPQARGRYHFWFDTNTHQIGCGWATMLRLRPWQPIVHTCTFNPSQGFTEKQWEEIAEKFRPYFL